MTTDELADIPTIDVRTIPSYARHAIEMTGTSLCRWTMAYFAVALMWLLTAQALMAAGLGYPAGGLRDPGTLVVVISWRSAGSAC